MLSAARNASIALAMMVPAPVLAASSQASDPFAGQVEQKCADAASEFFRRPKVAVDPAGTQSYGVAIVYGRSMELKGPAAAVCVVDRRTGKVEIGTPLGKEVVRVRKPKAEGQDDQQPRNKRRQQQNQQNQNSQQNDMMENGADDNGDDPQ